MATEGIGREQRRRLWLAGLLLLAALAAAHAALFQRYLTDDAFISFRYLDLFSIDAAFLFLPRMTAKC